MTLKLKAKIFIIFVGLVSVSSIINIGITGITIQNNLTNDLISRIVTNTRAGIADITNFVLIKDKDSIFNSIYNQKSTHRDLAYMLVLDQNNEIIASTLLNQDPIAIATQNILASDATEHVTLIKDAEGKSIYDIALRLDYSQGTLRAGYYKDQIDNSIISIIYRLIAGGLGAIAIAFLLAYFFTKTFFKPLDILKEAVQKISAGDLTVKAKVTSKDELGFLAEQFNQMGGKLQTSYEKLESRVAEKTKELNQKVEELEKFNHIMVDRELKMVELKNEIKKLKESQNHD